jgi:hypothetical protein
MSMRSCGRQHGSGEARVPRETDAIVHQLPQPPHPPPHPPPQDEPHDDPQEDDDALCGLRNSFSDSALRPGSAPRPKTAATSASSCTSLGGESHHVRSLSADELAEIRKHGLACERPERIGDAVQHVSEHHDRCRRGRGRQGPSENERYVNLQRPLIRPIVRTARP